MNGVLKLSKDHRRRLNADEAGCTLQDELLNFALYTQNGTISKSVGREFQVTVAATCLGARVYLTTGATYKLSVWRVSDQARIKSQTGFVIPSLTDYDCLFTQGVAVVPGQTYRIVIYRDGTVAYRRYNAANHPDGPNVTLTGWCRVENESGDLYPSAGSTTLSMALEPIICV